MRERWQPNGWSTSLSGSRARNCSKMGSMMYGEMAGTGTLLHIGKLREPPDDRVSRARITSECAASLLAQALSAGSFAVFRKRPFDETHLSSEHASPLWLIYAVFAN